MTTWQREPPWLAVARGRVNGMRLGNVIGKNGDVDANTLYEYAKEPPERACRACPRWLMVAAIVAVVCSTCAAEAVLAFVLVGMLAGYSLLQMPQRHSKLFPRSSRCLQSSSQSQRS